MKLTIVSGGPHAPGILTTLLTPRRSPHEPIEVTCIASTAHDMGFAGLRLCPDLDAAVRALAGTTHGSSTSVRDQLGTWGLTPAGRWPDLTDESIAAGLARNIAAAGGADAVGAAALQLERSLLAAGSGTPAHALTVLPATDTPVELHVIEPDGDARRGRHVQRWLADPDRREPEGFAVAGLDATAPAAGVLDAIRASDLVVLAPMSPVLDAAGVLGVSGVREALAGTSADVVVLSPAGLEGPRDPRAEAAAWAQAGLDPTSSAVARLYADFIDRLVIDTEEAPGRYPASMHVMRAPIAAAARGDETADAAVRAAVLGRGA